MDGYERSNEIISSFFCLSLESIYYFERRLILDRLLCQAISPCHGSPKDTIESALKNGYISTYEYDRLMYLYSCTEVFQYD